MVPVLCSTESLQGALLGGENSTGRDVGEWSVVLLLPRDPWLHWSIRVEEAEVGNRAQRAVGTMGGSPPGDDFSGSAQLCSRG